MGVLGLGGEGIVGISFAFRNLLRLWMNCKGVGVKCQSQHLAVRSESWQPAIQSSDEMRMKNNKRKVVWETLGRAIRRSTRLWQAARYGRWRGPS